MFKIQTTVIQTIFTTNSFYCSTLCCGKLIVGQLGKQGGLNQVRLWGLKWLTTIYAVNKLHPQLDLTRTVESNWFGKLSMGREFVS